MEGNSEGMDSEVSSVSMLEFELEVDHTPVIYNIAESARLVHYLLVFFKYNSLKLSEC